MRLSSKPGKRRSELKQTYFRLEEARPQTLAEWGILVEGLERTHHDRLIKQKMLWEAQERERIRKRGEHDDFISSKAESPGMVALLSGSPLD